MKANIRDTIKIYLKATVKYPWVFAIIIGGTLAANIFEVTSPLFYKKFFDLLVENAPAREMVKIIIYIAFINFGAVVSLHSAFFAANYSQSKVIADLSNFCFSILHRHSFAFFNNNFVGSLTKKVNRFTRSYESAVDRFCWDILPLIFTSTAILLVLFHRNVWLGLIIISWIIFFLFINFLFIKFKIKYDLKRSEYDSKLTGLLADTITNNANVKLFGGAKKEEKSFSDLNDILRKLRRFIWDLGNGFSVVQALMAIGLEFGIFYFALKLKAAGILTLGDFVLIQAYLLQIFSKIWNFGRIIQRIFEDLAEAQEMTDVILTPPAITDASNAVDLKVNQGKIEYQNVDFAYKAGKKMLDKFNLSIKPGEKIALVGPSGAGKTTIIKLLLRMHELTNGNILIDKQNINEVTQKSLWQNISLVPQDPILFHRTLKENICYGKPEATDEEVTTAAKLAHCDEFIKEFPEGYGTYVGERGLKLSGGERQRVAIARAILRNAPILILDEATSSLDSISERLIQDALNILMRSKTVIVVAHRLSTIMKMDRIAVIQTGGIIEEGAHNDLLQKEGGAYKKLWEMQTEGFIK